MLTVTRVNRLSFSDMLFVIDFNRFLNRLTLYS
ncbi:hypothetical protein FWK35_00006385 [Aphis craccivora]|uniref:Uncharacterized protein n=2 Tax=Aphis craccivora TaxID=307492 RepID=A0A6G0ZND5_APHCR|nr:hypothetical protein FWK35_00029300 [Aphis craccivora]KAF0772713.1 hypothetical protein FWK35_00006385 [Aphis craccivora]